MPIPRHGWSMRSLSQAMTSPPWYQSHVLVDSSLACYQQPASSCPVIMIGLHRLRDSLRQLAASLTTHSRTRSQASYLPSHHRHSSYITSHYDIKDRRPKKFGDIQTHNLIKHSIAHSTERRIMAQKIGKVFVGNAARIRQTRIYEYRIQMIGAIGWEQATLETFPCFSQDPCMIQRY